MEPNTDLGQRDARGSELTDAHTDANTGADTDANALDREVLAAAPLRADTSDIRAIRAAVLRERSASWDRGLEEPEPLRDEYEYEWPGIGRQSHRRRNIAAVAIVVVGAAGVWAAKAAPEPTGRVVATVEGGFASAGDAFTSVRNAVADLQDAAASSATAPGADVEGEPPVEAVTAGYAAARLVDMQGATKAVPAAKVPDVRLSVPQAVPAAVPQPVRPAAPESRPRVASSSEPVRQRIATQLKALEEYERTQASLQSTHDAPVPTP